MDDLIKSISSLEIEKVTGESQDTIKLLKLYVEGDVSALLGKDWQGHYFKNSMLFVPEWRRGFNAHEIRSMFYRCRLVAGLESEIRLLKQQLEERNAEIEILEIRADFYRRQVILESRFGMMLQRSFL